MTGIPEVPLAPYTSVFVCRIRCECGDVYQLVVFNRDTPLGDDGFGAELGSETAQLLINRHLDWLRRETDRALSLRSRIWAANAARTESEILAAQTTTEDEE